MNGHSQYTDLLPLYVSGILDNAERQAVERHLPDCAECRADLALWRAVSTEISAGDRAIAAPRGLAEQALLRVRPSHARPAGAAAAAASWQKLRRAGYLLRSQMPLVNREIWPASALVIGLGYIAALLSAHSGFIYALAPLVAAACISLIYGPENDPAFELVLSTPTSPRQILLARLVLVFSYNLGLVLLATLGLLPVLAAQPSQALLGPLVLTWLAPMTFLTAAALVLSLWIGAANAISLTYIAWLAQLISGPLRSPQAVLILSPEVLEVMAVYQNFWQTPSLLLALSALLFAAAVWLVGRKGQGQLNAA